MAQIDRDQYTFFNDSVVSTAAPQLGAMDLAKRAFDIVASGSAILLASPLLLLMYAAVRLDSPGPAFFSQVLLLAINPNG